MSVLFQIPTGLENIALSGTQKKLGFKGGEWGFFSKCELILLACFTFVRKKRLSEAGNVREEGLSSLRVDVCSPWDSCGVVIPAWSYPEGAASSTLFPSWMCTGGPCWSWDLMVEFRVDLMDPRVLPAP